MNATHGLTKTMRPDSRKEIMQPPTQSDDTSILTELESSAREVTLPADADVIGEPDHCHTDPLFGARTRRPPHDLYAW